MPYDYREQVKRTGEDFHTVKTLVEYCGPIHFDDEIEVGVRAAKIGRTSLTFRFEILPKASDSCLASGDAVWVNTDQESHRLAPLFMQLVEKLNALDGVMIELLARDGGATKNRN